MWKLIVALGLCACSGGTDGAPYSRYVQYLDFFSVSCEEFACYNPYSLNEMPNGITGCHWLCENLGGSMKEGLYVEFAEGSDGCFDVVVTMPDTCF